jgi:hypothetical protein
VALGAGLARIEGAIVRMIRLLHNSRETTI